MRRWDNNWYGCHEDGRPGQSLLTNPEDTVSLESWCSFCEVSNDSNSQKNTPGAMKEFIVENRAQT